MRPVSRGNIPTDEYDVDIEFTEYSRTRQYLIERIGEYCSYCERKIPANLAVEHVHPKDLYPALELEWSNLLLACTNCNSTKGKKDVKLCDYVFPDMGNSFELFEYSSDGIVKPAKGLSSRFRTLAINMIRLVGLDKKSPKKGTIAWQEDSDRRQKHRIQALIESEDYRKKYSAADQSVRDIMKDMIITIAVHQGFWSIWMHAFASFPEIQRELVNSYCGTNKTFFN